MSSNQRMGHANWNLLLQAPLSMWLGMSVVDTFTASLETEAGAFESALAEGAEKFGHNELIAAVAKNANRPTQSQKRGNCSVTPEELLRRLRRVSRVLKRYVDESDAKEIRKFLMDFGWDIAWASSESPWGGNRVSEAEEQFLSDADRALNSANLADVA